MNTFWLKIAGIAVVSLIVIGVGARFMSGGGSSTPARPAQKEKTFYDQVEQDRQNFAVEPQPAEPQPVEATPPQTQAPAQPQAQAPVPAQPPAEPTVIYVKPLSEDEQIEAQRLMDVAVPGRSIGRLPGPRYGLMIQTCQQVIDRWPESWYGFQAKRMLADIPEQDREGHHITAKQIDLTPFYQKKPGTVPMKLPQAGR